MAVFILIISVLVIVAWSRASKEVELPPNLEYAIIRWKERYPSSPLITKTIELGEQAELNVIEALSILQGLEHRGEKRLSLQIKVSFPAKGEKGKLLACLRRRFPEVGFIPLKSDLEEGHQQNLKV